MHPVLVERQVAKLVGDTVDAIHDRRTTTSYVIDRERTEAMFGANLPELLRLLSSVSLTEDDPFVREAGNQARSWLTELAAREK